MQLAVFMDPPQTLDPDKDTSLAMLAAATLRGWSCGYFTLRDIYAENGQILANVTAIRVDARASTWQEGTTVTQNLADNDIILVRKDPPFNLAYLSALQLLILVTEQGVLVANPPQSLCLNNEKLSILHYPNCCAPTLVSADANRLYQFWQKHQSVIFKPLHAMGGQNIFHVSADGRNIFVILEVLTAKSTIPIMAQLYIPEVSTSGDKRILLIHGEPVPYALARFPAPGESRANLAAGGQGTVVPITAQDRDLCAKIAPALCAEGLYFVGLDVIGHYITEINITSPTCLRQISVASGLDIAGDYLDFLAARAIG